MSPRVMCRGNVVQGTGDSCGPRVVSPRVNLGATWLSEISDWEIDQYGGLEILILCGLCLI